MRHVTAAEFALKFTEYQQSVREGAIQVSSPGGVAGYFVSPEEYAEYEALKAKARQVLQAGSLPESWLAELRGTAMDNRHAHLDALMDD